MTDAAAAELCDYCRLPHSAGTVEATFEGDTYGFCSTHCRDAMLESDRVFTRYHGHRRFQPGVAAIDASLPQGCPRNSFVLVSAQAGTRDLAVQAELIWRTLQRGEPATVVTFQDPPSAVVERFFTLDWNVLPYLESGQLRFVDCFTYRMEDLDRARRRMSTWNRHIADAVDPATARVRDAGDVAEITNKLDNQLEDAGMIETGVVVIDSLTEFGTLVQPIRAYDFVKDVRADICKGRFLPVFAGATVDGNADGFPHDLAYVADGVIDMRLDGEVVDEGLVKRLRVRKLNGVLSYQRWTAYEFTAGRGLVTFDPAAQADADGTETTATDDAPDPAADSTDADDVDSHDVSEPADGNSTPSTAGTDPVGANGHDSGQSSENGR